MNGSAYMINAYDICIYPKFTFDELSLTIILQHKALCGKTDSLRVGKRDPLIKIVSAPI